MPGHRNPHSVRRVGLPSAEFRHRDGQRVDQGIEVHQRFSLRPANNQHCRLLPGPRDRYQHPPWHQVNHRASRSPWGVRRSPGAAQSGPNSRPVFTEVRWRSSPTSGYSCRGSCRAEV
jgi:hypothetical protein